MTSGAPGNDVSLPWGFAPEEALRDEGALRRVYFHIDVAEVRTE